MRERRKRIIVDKGFQYRLALSKVLVAIIAANFMIMLAFYFFPYELGAVMGPFTWTIGLFEVLLIATVLYLGTRSSRRIAGPAYALKRSLQRLGDGDLSVRARFRQNDYLHDVADVFNDSVERLGGRLDNLRGAAESLRSSLPEGSPGRQQADDLAAQLEALSGTSTPDPAQSKG